MLLGGGTTCGLNGPVPFLDSDPPASDGGGGTGLARRSPDVVLPQLLRSRLTCEGGGATTTGAGSVNFELDVASRRGAETAGATTSTVCVSGSADRILSRATLGVVGVGGMMALFSAGAARPLLRETSGAGAMTFVSSPWAERLVDAFNSGEGGAMLIAGRVGAVREDRKPSAGGGPGFALKASRLATAESEWGRLTLGASTTFSAGLLPRTTRLAWVRGGGCGPPARPALPACAPPRSLVCGNSSPE